MHTPSAEKIAIILVEPQSPGNIGMVCRAMMNFGAADLRLVNPCPYLHPEAAKFAVFARELLGRARIFDSLAAASADLQSTVALTRRTGRLRGELQMAAEIPAIAGRLPAGGRLGLVFGREDAGLTNEEIAQCAHAAAIPSCADTGSLNLAQAVVVCLYELARVPAAAPASVASDPPDQGEMEALFGRMEEILTRIAFLSAAAPEREMAHLRRIFRRAAPDRRELGLLRGMWDQIAWSIRDWRGRKRGENGGDD